MNPHAIRKAIASYLAEDIASGDITTEAIFAADYQGEARFIAKEDFLCAGMDLIAAETFRIQDRTIEILSAVPDTTAATPGMTLLHVKGPVCSLLGAERVALNLVQRLCGIATHTATFVRKVKDLPVVITDTRKTTPGMRIFEKYAVRVGGGRNHRFNLADGILIKDNHIAASGSIAGAVNKVRSQVPHTLKIEVEADNLDQVAECLDCGVDIILLDNMTPEQLRRAKEMVRGRALLEASGGVTLDTVREIAETGVDIISIGALTHSSPSCDISMEMR